MSIEGFLLKRKRIRTPHNIYQLIADDQYFDLDVAVVQLIHVTMNIIQKTMVWIAKKNFVIGVKLKEVFDEEKI